jgi:branched-subunit amino acid aminotransferase/4-amino-4-deoxychorismate lyase
VTDGCVRALEAHRRRFARSCQVRAGVPEAASDRFWDALVELLPRTGDWFPRVELVQSGPSQTMNTLHLRFRVRPAPARGTTVVVWDPQVPDARTHPQIKGPDLDQLGELRTKALALGAQEVLLTDEAGHVIEAANSSVYWWEDGALWTPASAVVPLEGVTAGLVAEAAQRRGITVRSRRITRAELEAHEVWLTNALHGIRAVSEWRMAGRGPAGDALTGSGTPSRPATLAPIDRARLQDWRDEWDAHAGPLPDRSARG